MGPLRIVYWMAGVLMVLSCITCLLADRYSKHLESLTLSAAEHRDFMDNQTKRFAAVSDGPSGTSGTTER